MKNILFLKASVQEIGFAYSTPLPLNLEGIGVSFFYFFLHNRFMNILQKIFTDYYEEIKTSHQCQSFLATYAIFPCFKQRQRFCLRYISLQILQTLKS